LVGALVLPLLAQADGRQLVVDPGLGDRALIGLLLNGVIAVLALGARSVDRWGAVSAIAIGVVVTAGLGVNALAIMVAFFVVGSVVTRIGYPTKAARGIAQEKGGARGARHAWANGAVPAFLAAMAALSPPLLRDLLVLAYAASVATAAADTCSSEVGKAFGRRTFLITSGRPVPPGTEGAISLEGTLGGFLGALAVASVGAVLGLYSGSAAVLVAFAGLLGCLAESLIGAFTEGGEVMGNDLLNAANTAMGAVFVVLLARSFGLAGSPAP
jgi:uncharacterized protein (TIGR00297 family)